MRQCISDIQHSGLEGSSQWRRYDRDWKGSGFGVAHLRLQQEWPTHIVIQD